MSKKYFHGYKFKLFPSRQQQKILDQFINEYRFVYNWAIEKEKQAYEDYINNKSDKSFLQYFDLCRIFCKETNENPKLKWIGKGLPKSSCTQALKEVVDAYANFFKGITKHTPGYKSKKRAKESFKLRNNRFYITEDKVRISGFTSKELVAMKFNSGFNKDTKYYRPTVSKDKFGNYWISFSVEEDVKIIEREKSAPIGIDLGVRTTFTVSTGEKFNQPIESINKLNARKSKIQRHISRDIKRMITESKRTRTKYDSIPKSKRHNKRIQRLNKIYAKISNIQTTFYQQTVSKIIKRNPEAVVIEGAFVKDLVSHKKYMGKQMRKTSFSKAVKIIMNNCIKYNIPLIRADKEFPSSQLCSECGYVHKKLGNAKIFKCPNCGAKIDRDINAAINLRNLVY